MSILSDLNSGYTLLEKVLKDLGILPNTSTSSTGSKTNSGTSSTKNSTPNGATFTLTLNPQPLGDGTATVTGGGTINPINCSSAQQNTCSAQEPVNIPILVYFSAVTATPPFYLTQIVSSPVKACVPLLPATGMNPNWQCFVTADQPVTVTATWQQSP